MLYVRECICNMTVCGFCDNTINARKPSISCCSCKKQHHASCLTTSSELVNLLKEIKGLSWKCTDCTENCLLLNNGEIKNFLDEKIETALSALDGKLASFKSEISTLISSNSLHTLDNINPLPQPSYSDILKNKTQPAVIVLPKNPDQSVSKTKCDMLEKIDPINSELQFTKVKTVKNGGMVIGCHSKEESEKLRKMVQEKMSDSYVVRELNGISPRIRIVGMTEKYREDVLINYFLKCNSDLMSHTTNCKLIKLYPTKKNKDIYQAILQLDRNSYDKIIKAGNIFIGYDSCCVFDAIHIYRCFNCNEFHHNSNKCNKPVSCPRCSLNHDVKRCQSESLCCSNCLNLKNKHNIEISTDHAVWDLDKCSAYSRARDKLRNDVLAGR